MSKYDETNRGQIWGNDRKEKDSQPDFKGTINVEGVEYWVSAWKRKPDANPKAPALTFSIQNKEQRPEQNRPAPPPQNQPMGDHQASMDAQAPDDDFGDSIPF